MNDTKREMIAELAADHEKKRAKFEALGYQNTYGLTAKQREEQSAAYAIAEAEMLEAGSRLRGAIGSAGG